MKDERAWYMPDADTLGRAIVLAEDAVSKLGVSHVICAVNVDGEIGFNVLQAEAYAALREMQKHKHMMLMCSVLPGGRVEVYPPLKPFEVLPDASRRHE